MNKVFYPVADVVVIISKRTILFVFKIRLFSDSVAIFRLQIACSECFSCKRFVDIIYRWVEFTSNWNLYCIRLNHLKPIVSWNVRIVLKREREKIEIHVSTWLCNHAKQARADFVCFSSVSNKVIGLRKNVYEFPTDFTWYPIT